MQLLEASFNLRDIHSIWSQKDDKSILIVATEKSHTLLQKNQLDFFLKSAITSNMRKQAASNNADWLKPLRNEYSATFSYVKGIIHLNILYSTSGQSYVGDYIFQ